jgi:hypothetical protein
MAMLWPPGQTTLRGDSRITDVPEATNVTALLSATSPVWPAEKSSFEVISAEISPRTEASSRPAAIRLRYKCEDSAYQRRATALSPVLRRARDVGGGTKVVGGGPHQRIVFAVRGCVRAIARTSLALRLPGGNLLVNRHALARL